MRFFPRGWSRLGPSFLASLALASACGGDPEPVALEASVELLDSFSYDTGALPGSGPVQVSLKVSGSATAKLRLPAIASEASGGPALHAAGPGTIEVSGGFFLDGTLKVDQTGLPKYDGDLPGLADVSLPISGSAPVMGFAIDEPVTVSAVIQPGDLPPIPLPGGLPGKLQLSVGEGSTIDVTIEGTCASVEGSTAGYQGTAIRAGTVNLDIAVELDTGFAGTKSFDIGTVAIPLPEAGYDVGASAEGVSMEDAPEGSKAAPACEGPAEDDDDTGEGGAGVVPSASKGSATSAGTTGSGSGPSTSGNTSSTSTGSSLECSVDEQCDDGEVCRQGACKQVLELCVNQTIHIGDLNLIEGDAEFDGNGPEVQVDLNPVATSSGIDVNVHIKMRETQSDWTTGERSQTFSYAGQIGSVVSPGLGWTYTDDDTSDDALGGYEGMILSGKCSADTFGNDVCNGSNCSWCEIEIGCFLVTAP
jgi:hypothetical protein